MAEVKKICPLVNGECVKDVCEFYGIVGSQPAFHVTKQELDELPFDYGCLLTHKAKEVKKEAESHE